jgi:hypothetical protein
MYKTEGMRKKGLNITAPGKRFSAGEKRQTGVALRKFDGRSERSEGKMNKNLLR